MEVRDPRVRGELAERRRDQRQVVVLDQHGGGCAARLLGERVGEAGVDGGVVAPCLAPVRHERGLAREIPQVVMEEPQQAIADVVVEVVVGALVEREQSQEVLRVLERHLEASVRALLRPFAVALAHGGGDPQACGVLNRGGECRHEPAAASAGDELSLHLAERDRTAVGRDEHAFEGHSEENSSR
jgi:hypothetical protein